MVDPRSRRLSAGSFRFSRASSAFALQSAVERPPVILDWSSAWLIRVGLAEQHAPQHLIPWNDDGTAKVRSKEDWYFVIAPLVAKIWKRTMLDPSSRRVVCVTPSLCLPKAWEAAMKQALLNLGVPAICFISCLETVPIGMGWKRGLVVHVGKQEAQCLVMADGASLHFTFQAVPCGYETVVSNKETIQVEWTKEMDTHWLDETNPNSLVMALLKCLSACPTDLKRDVISNLVLVGDALVLVPDLARQVRNRLIAILDKTAVSFDEEPVSELTVVPTDCNALAPLKSSVAVTSTAPLRPDLVSWVGASLWASVWHRHDTAVNANWIFAPGEIAS